MAGVTVRDLRNRGGEVLDRVSRGETLIVTKDGRPIAELRPLRRSSVNTAELIRRRQNLPRVDDRGLRVEIDAVIDQAL
jgi:prevent-host-death family protein